MGELETEQQTDVRIFSGDYSRKMWHEINSAEIVEELRDALYLVCCRLQELETLLVKKTKKSRQG